MDHIVIFLLVLLSATGLGTVAGITPTTKYPCGQTFSDDSRSFAGEYYDGGRKVLECLWTIESKDKLPIKATIDYVELSCDHEYISIYNGEAHHSQLLGKICDGSALTFVSFTGIMSVFLHRDSEITGPGFFAYYDIGELEITPSPAPPIAPLHTSASEILTPGNPEIAETTKIGAIPTTNPAEPMTPPGMGHITALPTALPTLLPTVTQCGGNISFPSAYISGPPYAGNNTSEQCVWEITVEPSYYIELQISSISLDCNKEYIEIIDGNRYSRFVLGKICSDAYLNYTYTSTDNIITILLHRDSDISGNGFLVYYNSAQEILPTTTLAPHPETAVPATSPGPVSSTSLLCFGDYMVARIRRTYLQSIGYDAKDVYLKSPDSLCRPEVTKDDVIFKIPFSSCGTVRQERNNETISYSNIIMTSASGDIITREKNFQFHIVCEMNENTIVETLFITHNSVDVTEIHRGSYQVNFNFYESPSFSNEVHSSPYYVSINQKLYFQATLSSPDPNLVLFVDTCKASPYARDFRTLTYDLIRSGCVRDFTYTNLPSPNKNAVRFQFNAFKFLKEHNSVYLQCKLVICKGNNPSSRCSQGCLSRKKRNIDEDQDKVNFVVGPFKLQ